MDQLSGETISVQITKMGTKINPAETGLPTLLSASTANARPWSVGKRCHRRGNAMNVRAQHRADPNPIKNSMDPNNLAGPKRGPKISAKYGSIVFFFVG